MKNIQKDRLNEVLQISLVQLYALHQDYKLRTTKELPDVNRAINLATQLLNDINTRIN